MKVISCISFHGTGSGAVDDIFKEFDDIPSAASDIECRFLQDPDGISDLEYNLIENPHRLNSGYALKRYLAFANKTKWTYKKIFGDKWIEYSKEYINNLTSITYKGYWHGDLLLLNKLERIMYYSRKAINKILPKKLRKPGYYNYFPNIDYLHTYITEELFLDATRRYCEKLCKLLNPNNYDFVLLDQFVATSNIDRYMRYIDNIKVIVVDRDPRDLYINQRVVKDHVLPKDPYIFSKVYRDQRRMASNISNNPNILHVQFEDLIYNYDITVNKIIDFIGLDKQKHIRRKKLFDPQISIKNTKMWEKHLEYKDDIEIIANELKEFLYFN